jgi:indolepyruvate ferredoxin oxidoreductase
MAKSSKVSLADKFDLTIKHQLLTGTQAVVRLILMQRAKDVAAGLNTAGYVTGYRGSPIAGLEGAFQRVGKLLADNHLKFQSGLNEDLAATAIWGSQQVGLYPQEAKYDGVFSIWYGKGPGVDRTGDVFRHANHAGTAKHGGVLAMLGDDHNAESSTTAHQSEFAMVDFMMPVLNPAGVQEIIDYGLHGFALSRFAGVWVGVKCVKDNIESTATVDGRIDRVTPIIPTDFAMPPGGLNIRLGDSMLPKEARLHDYKRDAILAYARANKLDKIVCSGGAAPKIGIITTGKSYLDVRQAMEELGIDEVAANEIGLRLYKVAMPYPMEVEGLKAFAKGLDLIIVVEEKRSLLEVQVKEELFNYKHEFPAQVIGKRRENDKDWLFPAKGSLDPTHIAIEVGERIVAHCHGGRVEGVKAKLAALRSLQGNEPAKPEAASRLPYFCPGCPHNSSTVVPEGSRAYAGIGCHFMAHWMDRRTEGFTQMGGEGSNWIGEAPFVKTKHVFQNLGDGTYTHSGSLAIRAAMAAGVNITYKILYNDAVAMTGGQSLDGGLTPDMIVRQVLAEGVRRVDVVTDEPEKYSLNTFPRGVAVHHRRDLDAVQKELRDIEGVTVLVYDQTCAAEKRRRRKRGLFPDPDKRVLINADVCEGCGDCSKKSNCVAVSPLETALGTKRQIDQSGCNKDFSCTNGFCPSFVTVNGAKVRKSKAGAKPEPATQELFAGLPTPKQPDIAKRAYTMLVTGVGGTGVVTIAAVLGQAAHIEGKGFGGIEMTGLAQKGGAVACHMRVAADPADIHAIRAGVANADLILGCDLVVTASNKILETVRPDHTAVVYSPHETNVAMFTLNANYKLPGGALAAAIHERARKGPLAAIDAQTYAVKLFGDSIASNMFMLGYAVQLGHVPVGPDAIEQAIDLNGAAVEMNRNAFRMGRLAAHDLTAVDKIVADTTAVPPAPVVLETLESVLAHRKALLTDYQDAAYAERYEATVRRLADVEKTRTPGKTTLALAAAKGLYKLMAYKDEYEVGRLYSSPSFKVQLDAQFSDYGKLEFHLAPPLLARHDKATGEPRKIKFGPWMLKAFGLLAKAKGLRGGRFDVFGYTAERRHERQMIAEYEGVLGEIAERLSPANHATAVSLAALALDIKGFGHVKAKNYAATRDREAKLLAALRDPAPSAPLRQAAE